MKSAIGLVELVGRRRHIGQAPVLALLAGQQLAREQELLGLAQPDVARQAVDRPGAAEQRAADVEVADAGLVRRDAEVAGDHELEAAGDRVALDDGDRRLAEIERAIERARGDLRDLHRVVRRPQELAVEHVEVGAGAERVPAPADQDHADLRVLVGALERRAQAREQVPVDAVLHLGAIEPDRGDPAVELVLDDLAARGGLAGLLLNGHALLLRWSLSFKLNSNHIHGRADLASPRVRALDKGVCHGSGGE